MAEELMMRVSRAAHIHTSEAGFVLVTSLIMLSLLTLMSLGMFYASRSGTQTSAAAQHSTEAYYYTESAIHYMSWAIGNDAEFDNYTYSGAYVAAPFGEPPVPASANTIGDYNELIAYLWDPGPVGVSGGSGVDSNGSDYTAGQVMYLDNSPMVNRYLCMEAYTNFANCLDVTLSPGDGNRVEPSMYQISAKLPRYIKLDIASSGVVTPSIPPLPHASTPVVGNDIPLNGAIVWLTAVDATDPKRDIEIFPLDPAGAYGGIAPLACAGGTLPDCPCTAPSPLNDVNDPNYAPFMAAQACDANTGTWLTGYGIAAYAIGYVNGRASHLIRAVIK